MKTGDKIRKLKGYEFNGTIRSVFENSKGETRIVAELDGNGMLHIFSPSQLELREESFGSSNKEEARQLIMLERQRERDYFFAWAAGNYVKGFDGMYRHLFIEGISATEDDLWREYNREVLNK